jgi:hypothetical protein
MQMTKMKRFKTYNSSFIILILVLASVFTLPNESVFSASGDPTISITFPTPNAIIKPSNLEFSGTYTDGQQTPNPVFTVTENSTEVSNSTNKPGEWNIDGTKGKWTFTPSVGTFSEGTHTITVSITDIASASSNITFTVVAKRPYISETGVIWKNISQYTVISGDTLGSIATTELGSESRWTDIAQLNKLTAPDITKDSTLPDGTKIDLPIYDTGEDLTNIAQDAQVKITLVDDISMDQLVSKIRNSAYNPVTVMLGTTRIEGSATIFHHSEISGNKVYDIFFKPTTSLTLNKTYLVYLDQKDPDLVDDSNGPVYAKFFKFTTKSNTDWNDIDDQTHSSANPHGHYQLNTNMCAACHSTHVDSPYQKDISNPLTPEREGGNYLIDFNDKLDEKAAENYCTACHDGTLNNAPIVDGIAKAYHHNNPADYDQANGTNNLKEASSCTSCHNPHLDWSAENPNLLKDHYVYTHQETITDENNEDKTIVDSLDTKCETCHEDNLIHNGDNTVTSIYDPQSNNYKVLAYKKSLTATGALSDYALCLRCHKAGKGATDIETLYSSANSGHTFTSPNDDGGSQLNGPLPCADCHETHGSNNIKMLKEQLGNLTGDKFSTTSTSWIPTDERKFCLKCHNNSTEIYGKTGIFKEKNSAGNPITGHEPDNTTQACSECHGTGTNKTLSAAHAPKKLP